jgi:hypothetical protein
MTEARGRKGRDGMEASGGRGDKSRRRRGLSVKCYFSS